MGLAENTHTVIYGWRPL